MNSWNEGFVQKYVSARRKKAFTVTEKYIKNEFPKPENQFAVPGMRHSLKNRFPLYKKSASSGKKIKENGSTSGKMFYF